MDVDWIIIHVATFSRATRICIRIISSVLSAMIFRIRSCRAINNVSNDILERAGKKGEQHIVAPIFWSSSYKEFRISLLAAKLGVFYIQPIRVEKIFPQTLCFMTRTGFENEDESQDRLFDEWSGHNSVEKRISSLELSWPFWAKEIRIFSLELSRPFWAKGPFTLRFYLHLFPVVFDFRLSFTNLFWDISLRSHRVFVSDAPFSSCFVLHEH